MISKPVPLQHFWSLIIPLQPMTWLGFVLTVLVTLIIVKNFPEKSFDSDAENNRAEDWLGVGFVIHIILDYSSSYLKHVR